MNELWETIQPYVVAFAQTGLGTAIVYVICKLCVSRWFRKNDMNSLVNGFASKLVGSTINVDLTAVAEKKLAEIETRLMETNAPLVQSLEEVKHLVAMVGQALSRPHDKGNSDKSDYAGELDKLCLKRSAHAVHQNEEHKRHNRIEHGFDRSGVP